MTIAIAKAAALAGVIVLAAGAAQAQSYPASGPGSPGYNYDPCRRDANQRGTAGALIGGGMGAVIGSNAAARNARTEGALLGGLLGAIAGGVIGNKTAACTSEPRYPTTASAPPPPPAPAYYERDEYAERGPPAEDCTLAESPIHMPDGRIQTRFVRVCRDASGKYAVVD